MSSHYRALTRAYRPQTFDDIVSQEHVSSTLKNAIANNRLSHAYLFCGPRGVGKTTMARVLARTINEVDTEVDGENLNNTLNIVEIDAASNNSVEDIRSLRERVRIPPQNGRYKVYIIDEIHMLSKSAFNALLKTLEEPPEHVIFIFATTEPNRILPTILSRCQRFDFHRITVEEIVDQLGKIANQEEIQIDRESLHVIAKKADGALRDALGILDQAVAFCGLSIAYDELHRALNIVSSERMFELTDVLIRKDTSAGMALINHLLHIGNDIQEFLGAITEHFRNLYLAKDSQNFYLIEATDETKNRFQKLSEHFSEDDLMRMMHILHDAQFSIRNAQQPRIHLEITILKLFHMTRSEGLQTLLLKLEKLEKEIASTDAPHGKSTQPSTETSTASTSKKAETSDVTSASKPVTTTKDSQNSRQAQEKDTDPIPQVTDRPGMFDPSIKRPGNHLKAVSLPQNSTPAEEEDQIRGNLALHPRPQPLQKHAEEPSSASNENTTEEKLPDDLDEIEKIWPTFLDKLQKSGGHMLAFTIQKTRPVAYNEGEITLECYDSFTSDIIHEKQRKLRNTLREHFGYALRFTSRLVEIKQRTDAVQDPYEHFNTLQKKDPKLQKIVELFGAELEY